MVHLRRTCLQRQAEGRYGNSLGGPSIKNRCVSPPRSSTRDDRYLQTMPRGVSRPTSPHYACRGILWNALRRIVRRRQWNRSRQLIGGSSVPWLSGNLQSGSHPPGIDHPLQRDGSARGRNVGPSRARAGSSRHVDVVDYSDRDGHQRRSGHWNGPGHRDDHGDIRRTERHRHGSGERTASISSTTSA